MAKSALKFGAQLAREVDHVKWLPYLRHVDDTTVSLESGALMRMYRVEGRPFETCDPGDLNAWHQKMNIGLRQIGDDRFAMWTHLVRTAVDPLLAGEFTSGFANHLNQKYADLLGAAVLYANEFYLTVLAKPSQAAGSELQRIFGRSKSQNVDGKTLALLNEKCRELERQLVDCKPSVLGLYDKNGVVFSQPMEVLHFIMTGDRLPVPLIRGQLGQALYSSRIIFGRELIEVRTASKSKFAGIFGIREYVATTRPGQFNDLLKLDFGFVLTQSFAPEVKATAVDRFTKKYRQMASSDDLSLSQTEELLVGADRLMANDWILGEHHLSLMVMDTNHTRLLDRLAQARVAAGDTGMVMAREDYALEAAFWAQLPGNFSLRARPARITSRNFAALSPFYTYPAGKKSGNHWGEAVTLLKTRAESSYSFNFHLDDLGHTLIIGPSGGGKTVLQNFMMCQLEKTGAKRIFIDKDRGAEIFVRACGGTYLPLKNGKPTGFAPLKALENTPKDVAFLQGFIRVLVTDVNKPFTVSDNLAIDEGLQSVMRQPAHQRTLGSLREILGYEDPEGIGARLERWCAGGTLGWAFDNRADEISLEANFCGFDMTDFLENAEIRAPTMAYLFQRIDALLDGRRVVVDIDEFWKALGDQTFQSFIKDGLKTWRKRNGFLIFGTQSPEDALRSEIAATIVEQTATLILLPNSRAQEEHYIGRLGLTRAEFKLIREDLTPESRCFLVKQGHVSVVVRLDLAGLKNELDVLSGREETIKVMENAIKRHGANPDAWLPAFYASERKS